MQKTCLNLRLKECHYCIYSWSNYCLVYYYIKEISRCSSTSQFKDYLVKSLSRKFFYNDISYLKAAAFSINPEYISLIDKMLLLI